MNPLVYGVVVSNQPTITFAFRGMFCFPFPWSFFCRFYTIAKFLSNLALRWFLHYQGRLRSFCAWTTLSLLPLLWSACAVLLGRILTAHRRHSLLPQQKKKTLCPPWKCLFVQLLQHPSCCLQPPPEPRVGAGVCVCVCVCVGGGKRIKEWKTTTRSGKSTNVARIEGETTYICGRHIASHLEFVYIGTVSTHK